MENYTKIFEELISHVESEVVEYKAAARQFDTDKMGKYLSALSNEANLRDKDFAWLVMGVDNNREVCGTEFLKNETKRNFLKHDIASNTTGGLTFRDIIPIDVEGKRVLMFKIPASPRNTVTKWKGVAYGRNGESLAPLAQDKEDAIRYQSSLDDWSGHFVENASIADLDEFALAKARIEYKKVHPRIPAKMVDEWSVEEFLTRSKVMREGKLTRAALLLLGNELSEDKLYPAVARITWTLADKDDKRIDYEHFSIPFILTVDKVLAKIRNLTMRELPGGTLFPDTMQMYDDYTMREALHNCIAHQDYTLRQRINLMEFPDYLIYSNGGTFIPGTIENVLDSKEQQRFYRNDCLCQGMVNFNMIDTISHGIQTMFSNQKERHFPMPDYFIDNDKKEVRVKIYGKSIDDRYTQLLKNDASLSLKECIWLDAVQKHKPITDKAIEILQSKKLIEGRKPNFIISLSVARKTHQVSQYTKQKGLTKLKYENMVTEFLSNIGPTGALRSEIFEYLESSLPSSKSVKEKKRFVSYLLSILKKEGSIVNKGLRWRLVQSSQ